MQRRFIRKILVGATVLLLALAGAGVSISRADSDVNKAEPSAPVIEAGHKDESPDVSQKTVLAKNDKAASTHKALREMDDHEMDDTCGGITGWFDISQSGNMTLTDNSVQSISLSDQAQQNMSSMVNILSINSTISVMLNLNVNINSTVGTVNQGNSGTQNTGVQNTTQVGAP